MSDSILQLAARRAAAQRRYAKRQAELEEEENERNASPSHVSTRDEMSGAALIGTAYDAEESATSGSARLIRSAHEERRAVNQLIYGKLNEVDTTEFKPQAFIGRRDRERAAAASSSAESANNVPSSTIRASIIQRPEDFMDEEDRAELMATGNSKGTARTAFKGLATVGQAPDMLISPASDLNLTIRLLKGLGWRRSTQAANDNSAAASHKRKHEETKVYSASLPPGMVLEGGHLRPSFDGDESMSDLQAYMQLMEESDSGDKPQLFTAQRKDDTHGIGYREFVSHLSMAQRAKYDLSASAPLTFVRAKQVTDNNPLAKPKSYSIDVPESFDGKHYFPPVEAVKHQQPGHPIAVIEAWRGKMDAAQRGKLLGEAQPPPPPTTAPPAMQTPSIYNSSTAPSTSSSSSSIVSSSTPSTVSSEAMEQHRLHLQRLEQQRLQRHQPQAQQVHTPALPLPPPPPSSQPTMVEADGRINIQAVISAAAANAKSAMAARASRWGAAPTTTAQAPNVPTPAKQEYPLAEAFLQQMRTDAIPVPMDIQSAAAQPSPAAPPPPAQSPPTFQIPPELSALFPKFVVGATMDEKGNVHETHDESNASDSKVEGGILPPSQTSGAGSEIRLRVVQKKEPANEYEAAAQMKMFGKLTRKTEAWTPHNLLYKRFGLPAPSRLAQQSIVSATTMKDSSSTGKSVAGMPAFVESQVMFGSVPITAGLSNTSATSSTSGNSASARAAAEAQMAREEEEMIRADLLDDEDEDDRDNAPDESTMHDVAETSSEEKPSVDLFKAIFERTDDEEQQRRSRAKAKRIAEENSQRQKETSTAAPLFAAAKSSQADPLMQVVQSLPTSTKPAVAPATSQADTTRSFREASGPSNREIISLDSDDDVEMLESDPKLSSKPSEEKFREIAARLTKGLEFTSSSSSSSSSQNRKNANNKRSRESQPLTSSGFSRPRGGEEMDIYGNGGGASDEDDIGPHMASLARGRPNASAKAQFVPPPVKEVQQKVFTAPTSAWPFATSFLPSSVAATQLGIGANAAAASAPTLAPATMSTASTPNTLLAELLRLRKLKKQSKKEKKQKKEKKSKKEHKKSSKSHKHHRSHDNSGSNSSSDDSDDASSSDSSDASGKQKKSKKSSKKH